MLPRDQVLKVIIIGNVACGVCPKPVDMAIEVLCKQYYEKHNSKVRKESAKNPKYEPNFSEKVPATRKFCLR